jgi:short-subunit dehydrogenase
VLPLLARNGGGGLVLVSSVAGYRGLPKALGYGPPKAALIHFAETLFLDLRSRGVGVWVVNPGFVATRLTAQNDFRMPALMTPEAAAEAFLAGMASGRFDIHFPKRFTRFMKLLRLLPYSLYFRLAARTVGD